jgi:photosystem II stability/assembly factor-like uncharacterized protein
LNHSIYALAIDPQGTVYAGGFAGRSYGDARGIGGISKSTDGGATWTDTQVGSPSWISTLALSPQDPGTIYAGTWDGLIFKSSDGGASWSAITSGLPARSGAHVFVVDPQNPRTIYAGTSGSGVFKSPDGGETWSAVNSGLTTLAVNTLALDPHNSSTVYAGTADGGLFVITFAP